MMRMIIKRVCSPGGRRWLAVVAAVLAACGVAGAVPASAVGSSPVPDWTKQAPAVHPTALTNAAMAYDAATGTVVLFGGAGRRGSMLGGTWTWDGTTWTKQAPATSPPARSDAAMAYDAATGTIVLFGGYGDRGGLGDTWTWDGSTWTQQHPATSPPFRYNASMAYDEATDTIVLFGGYGNASGYLSDTWTWDGSTWTQQHPATSPSFRELASMAYDEATGTIVLFGGEWTALGAQVPHVLGGTWTWDGTTWTKQASAASPSARYAASMAYDAATGTIVLFSGYGASFPPLSFGGTWTWDGSTWTKQAPAASPPPRGSRRWPTTRPPATSSCSAAPANTAIAVTPGPGVAEASAAGTRPAAAPGGPSAVSLSAPRCGPWP